MPGPPRRFGEHLGEAIAKGELPGATLDAMVERLLRVRERSGAFERGDEPERAVDRPEHRKVARNAAAEAIVLLKNGGGVLPLDAASLRSLAVIGPNAATAVLQGGGSAQVTPHYSVSALEGIRARVTDDTAVSFERGCTRHKGVPVIAREAGGIPEALDGAGVLFDELEPRVLAELIHRVVTDKTLRQEVLQSQQVRLAAIHQRSLDRELRELLGEVLPRL